MTDKTDFCIRKNFQSNEQELKIKLNAELGSFQYVQFADSADEFTLTNF
ncbi:MAG: hypothetical protein R2831_05090 [Chitinophagaceae bacterium]